MGTAPASHSSQVGIAASTTLGGGGILSASSNPGMPVGITVPPLPLLPTGSLPPKLVKKILDLEYVNMAELVPDMWQQSEEEGPKCCHQTRRGSRRGPVTDILLWLECYTTMATLLATQYPQKAVELWHTNASSSVPSMIL